MTSLRRRIIDYSLAGLLLLLPVAILRSSLKDPEDLNGFDRAVLRISSPLQSAVSWIIEGVGGVWNRYIWLVNVEDENDELRRDNQRLRELAAEARRSAGDTQVYRQLLALRERTQAESVGAEVVGASLNPYFRVVRVRLDRGAGEVAEGMPVLDPDGALVGRIYRAYGDYSDVILVTDPDSHIMVQVPRTGATGWLTGVASDSGYRCKLDNFKGGDVAPGDQVVTTNAVVDASGEGGRAATPAADRSDAPSGLLVGTVSSVADNPVDVFALVDVTPAVDFTKLSTLLVLTAQAPPADPRAGKSAPPTAAYGLIPR